MTPRKTHVGAFQPTLESALAAEIIAYKTKHGPLAPLTVIVPTHLLGVYLRRKLAPHINIRFETLDALLQPARIPPRLGLEILCRQLARDLPADGYFAPVRDTAGFATALLETFKDLEQAGIQKFSGKTPKLRELAAAYNSYRQWLDDHFPQSKIQNPQSAIFLYGFYDLTTIQKRFIEQLSPSVVFFPQPSEFSRPLLEWFGGHASTLPRSDTPTILSCPGEAAEVREAFRVALAFLRDNPGKTFNDVAILFRSREQYDAIIRDVAGHCELPVFFRGGRPLSEHRDARLLSLLLEALTSDFARSSVMELAGHGGTRAHWDEISLELGIVGGRENWGDRLKRHGRAKELVTWLQPLFGLAEALPARGSWTEFIKPVLAAWRTLGGRHASIDATINALAELEVFQANVSLPEFAAACQQALEQAREATLPFQGGGIFVSDVMGARGLRFALVIVLGLGEKSFPRIIREDPLLLDAERRQISPDLPLKQRGHEEERLLFELTLGVAAEKIVLTYPRIDTGSARPRLPSSLLRQFKVEHKRVPLLAHDEPLDSREFDLALLKPGKIPAALLAEISPHLARGLEAERTRWGTERITPFDGLAPAAGVALEELVVAPTQLETFAFCPFKYFAKHILGLERWDEPEHIWSADPGEIGSVVHDILERFYKQATLPLQPRLRDVYRQQLIKLANERLDEFGRTGVTGLPVVWSLRQTALRRDLLRFLDLEIERADEFVPWKFETDFGVRLEQLRVTVKGRIDRIDVNAGKTGVRVLDYKTGKAWHKKNDALDGGEALQLPLYAMAAAKQWGIPVISSAYAYLTLAGGYQYVEMTAAGLNARTGDLARVLETFAAMLRAGEFPQHTGHGKCGWCDYRPICGSGIARLAERKLDDPRLAAFQAVKEIE